MVPTSGERSFNLSPERSPKYPGRDLTFCEASILFLRALEKRMGTSDMVSLPAARIISACPEAIRSTPEVMAYKEKGKMKKGKKKMKRNVEKERWKKQDKKEKER